MRSSGSAKTCRERMRMTPASLAGDCPYSGAIRMTSCPSFWNSRRNVCIDVETPLTRGKYTSDTMRMRTRDSVRGRRQAALTAIPPAVGRCADGQGFVAQLTGEVDLRRGHHGPAEVLQNRDGDDGRPDMRPDASEPCPWVHSAPVSSTNGFGAVLADSMTPTSTAWSWPSARRLSSTASRAQPPRSVLRRGSGLGGHLRVDYCQRSHIDHAAHRHRGREHVGR